MNIFISVYHMVRSIFTFPKKLFTNSKENKIKKEKEQEQKDRIARIQEEIKTQSKGLNDKKTDDTQSDDGLDGLIERKRVSFGKL